MKHLPNLLTLGNLFCGCMAIAYLLTAQPYVYHSINDGQLHWIMGTEQLYMGSIFIGIAAICDMLDGFAARALQVFSPIGKDLDSLADIVSFGVAPSMIMYKCLWDACMQEKTAMVVNFVDVGMLSMAPAFLVACFAALRLAKFNITAAQQTEYFIGLPTPAVGLVIGAFPLFIWSNYKYVNWLLQGKWQLYLFIALICFLMASNIKFLKLIPKKRTLPYCWPQLIMILGTIATIPFLQYASVLIAFLLYILLSLVYKYPESENPRLPQQ